MAGVAKGRPQCYLGEKKPSIPLCATHNRYLTHLLSYIFKYEMGRYVKKWSDGVLDTLQNEIKCVADRYERW